MAGQTENLLGKRAAVALRILTLKPKGKGPDQSQETFNLVHQPGRTNPADYNSRHPLPSRTFTKQEKREQGVEEEEEDAEIQVGRVLEVLSLGAPRVR